MNCSFLSPAQVQRNFLPHAKSQVSIFHASRQVLLLLLFQNTHPGVHLPDVQPQNSAASWRSTEFRYTQNALVGGHLRCSLIPARHGCNL